MLKIKRFFDVVLSLLGLLILFPLFVLIPILICLDSKGNPIFKQNRLTYHGKVFKMVKFRTMCENAEKMGAGLFNYKDDFRVTRVGKFLRRTSLDEIPQLINVLKGDMSLVGPRPPVEYELGNYEELSSDYKKRFEMRAGITGLAQVKGRNELPWTKKILYDNSYIRLYKKYGMVIDIYILFLTVKKVITMEDIYEAEENHMDKTEEQIRDEQMTKVLAGSQR